MDINKFLGELEHINYSESDELYSLEYEIICEAVKYSYYQIDDYNMEIKEIIYDVMKKCHKLDFLLDTKNNFIDIPYINTLYNGYEYEKFFSLNALRFVFGNSIPKRIIDRSYSPEVLVDNLWDDSEHNASEYFKVIFHKQLRENFEKILLGHYRNQYGSGYYDAMFKVLSFISQNYRYTLVTKNLLWVTKNLHNFEEKKELINRKVSKERVYFTIFGVNTIFLFLSIALKTSFVGNDMSMSLIIWNWTMRIQLHTY